MTRVAFVMASLGQGWLGGLSYFRNLFQALRELEAPAVSAVIITRPQTETRQLESFQPIAPLKCHLLPLLTTQSSRCAMPTIPPVSNSFGSSAPRLSEYFRNFSMSAFDGRPALA